MKKLLAMFAILASIGFVACSDDEDPQVGPTGDPELKLTSESVMNFTADGGKGTITFLLKNKVDGVEPTATCAADWVSDLKVGAAVTFAVAANEAEDAREADITVAYGDQSFKVTVKQAGVKGFDSDLELSVLQGQYFSDFEEYGVYNYNIFLSKNGVSFTAQGITVKPGDNIYSLDLYSDVAPADPMSVPVGTYAFDASDSCEPGTMGAEYSWYAETDANGSVVANPSYTAGTVTVSEGRIEATLTLEDGSVHHIVYEGSLALEEEEVEPTVWSNLTADVTFEGVEVTTEATNYGDFYEVGMDNYTVNMRSATHGMNLELLVPTGASLDGEYEILVGTQVDPSKYYALPGDVVEQEGKLYMTSTWYLNSTTSERAPIVGGTMTIATADGVVTYTVDMVDDAGFSIQGSFVAPAEGGGETPSDALSNLTGDVTFEDVNAEQAINSYGDYYGIGMNVFLGQVVSGSHSMTFQLIIPGNAENLEGVYQVVPADGRLDSTKYYFFPGSVNTSGQIAATWYLNQETDEMAPIVGGTIEIQLWASGITFYDINVVDDAGNSIKGTFIVDPAAEGSDVEMAVEDGLLIIEDYGDGYEVSMQNYSLTMIEADGEGHALMLDILLPFDSESIAGTYISAFSDESVVMGGTADHLFVPGEYNVYFPTAEGSMSGDMLVIEDGQITIEVLENNEYSFTFDCVFETGNTLVGTFKAVDMYAGGEEAKVKPQLSTLKNIKQKKAESKVAPMMQLQQVEKIQQAKQAKELMPLNIKSGKQRSLLVK